MRAIRAGILGLGVLCSVLGCGGGLVPARPTETVRVVGPSADALGRTIEVDARGFVHVELHEGPAVWVEPARVVAAALVPGTTVVVTDAAGTLVTATLVENLDRVLAVTWPDGARRLVPLDHVLAVLHLPAALANEVAVTVTPETPPAPPPPDPRRFATRATGTELFERVRVASCSGAEARILGDDGTITTMPVRELRPLRARVGDRVRALWQNGDTAYAGIVIGIEGRLANIRYEDGSEEWVQPAQIVGREATAAGTGACPRAGEDFAMARRGALRRVVELVSCEGSSVVVRTPGEETTERLALAELRALAVPEGARVEVLWHQSSPYPGWAGVTHDGQVDVRYDDGSAEPAPLTDVRWIASDFEAEPYLCPADG